MDYNQDLQIDRFQLDDALERQPFLYMQYQESMVEKQKELDDCKIQIEVAKDQLDNVESDLFIDYKKSKDENGKTLTDTAAKSLVSVDAERKQAFDKLINAKKRFNEVNYELGLVSSAVKSFEHRKISIAKLCELTVSGFISNVKQKRRNYDSEDLNNQVNQMMKKD